MLGLGLEYVLLPPPLLWRLDYCVPWIPGLALWVVGSCLGHRQPH